MALTQLFIQSYQSRSESFSAQRMLNLFWEAAPVTQGTKSPGVIFRRPGLEEFVEVGTGPIRGLHVMNGQLYAVSGKEVYRVEADGTTNLLIGDEMIGFDLVDMVDNGTQIAIVNGTDGYIATETSLTKITDPNFRPVSSVTFQDSYFIWTEAATARIFISPSFDGTGPYDPLDFATAEYAPDDAVKVLSDHDNLLIIGTDTTEPWYGSGDADFPFAPNPGTATELGIVSRQVIQKIDESLMFMSRDQRGTIGVWRSKGYNPVRVSTHPLEKKWEQAESLENAYAFTFSIEGHSFYVLTIPDFGTYVYDVATGLWCEWQTRGREDWSIAGFGYAFARRFVGDRRSNKVYELSLDYADDNGDAILWEATGAPIATPDGSLAQHMYFRIDISPGKGVTSGQGSDPKVYLQWADEDGLRFGNKKVLRTGKKGEGKKRAYLRRLGKARSRTYRISGSDPVPLAILGAYYTVKKGNW